MRFIKPTSRHLWLIMIFAFLLLGGIGHFQQRVTKVISENNPSSLPTVAPSRNQNNALRANASLPTGLVVAAPRATNANLKNLRTYTDNNFSIQYPAELTLSKQYTMVLFESQSALGKAKIIIDVWNDTQNKSLQQFVTDYSNGQYTNGNTNHYKIGAMDGLGYINGGDKVEFLFYKSSVYIFSVSNIYYVGTNRLINPAAENIFNQMLNTLTLLY